MSDGGLHRGPSSRGEPSTLPPPPPSSPPPSPPPPLSLLPTAIAARAVTFLPQVLTIHNKDEVDHGIETEHDKAHCSEYGVIVLVQILHAASVVPLRLHASALTTKVGNGFAVRALEGS